MVPYCSFQQLETGANWPSGFGIGSFNIRDFEFGHIVSLLRRNCDGHVVGEEGFPNEGVQESCDEETEDCNSSNCRKKYSQDVCEKMGYLL